MARTQSTLAVIYHVMPLCVTPPVLPSGLRVCICPMCRKQQLYQIATTLICEMTDSYRKLEKYRERQEEGGAWVPVMTACYRCDACQAEVVAKLAEIKPVGGTSCSADWEARHAPPDDSNRYGRAMYNPKKPYTARTDKAIGADLRYHGEGYDG